MSYRFTLYDMIHWISSILVYSALLFGDHLFVSHNFFFHLINGWLTGEVKNIYLQCESIFTLRLEKKLHQYQMHFAFFKH